VSRGDTDKLDELEHRVYSGVSKLRGIDLGDEVEVEILSQLVGSRRTATEIVEGIYGLGSRDEGFSSSYTRVRRGIRRLEARGLVSTNLLGRDKPYRLTDLAIINLARIGGESKQVRSLPRIDLVAYLATTGLSVPVVVLGSEWFKISDIGVVVLFAAFFFLLGASFVRFLQTLRRVF